MKRHSTISRTYLVKFNRYLSNIVCVNAYVIVACTNPTVSIIENDTFVEKSIIELWSVSIIAVRMYVCLAFNDNNNKKSHSPIFLKYKGLAFPYFSVLHCSFSN